MHVKDTRDDTGVWNTAGSLGRVLPSVLLAHTRCGGQALPRRQVPLIAKSLDPHSHFTYWPGLIASLGKTPTSDGTGTLWNCWAGNQNLTPHDSVVHFSCWLWQPALFSRSGPTVLCICVLFCFLAQVSSWKPAQHLWRTGVLPSSACLPLRQWGPVSPPQRQEAAVVLWLEILVWWTGGRRGGRRRWDELRV